MSTKADREALKAAAAILRTCRTEQRICRPDDQREKGARSTGTMVESDAPTVTVRLIVEAHAAFMPTVVEALIRTTEQMHADVMSRSLPDDRVAIHCAVTCESHVAKCVRDIVMQASDNAVTHAREAYAGQLSTAQMQTSRAATIC